MGVPDDGAPGQLPAPGHFPQPGHLPEPAVKNSPFAILGVFAVILVPLLAIWFFSTAISGGFTETLTGTAYASGEQDAPVAVPELETNALLVPGLPLPTVDCSLPPLGTDAVALEAYYRAGVACLDKAWQPVLTSAKAPFRSPRLSIADRPNSACGFSPSKERATAFYCNQDHSINMPRERLTRDAGDNAALHLAVLAHEYGHHVQQLSGILPAVDEAETESGSLELSRRTELQANCFAGMFAASVGGSSGVPKAVAEESVTSFEDSLGADSHGNATNQAKWAKAGYERNNTSACNTWSAPSSEVG